MIQQEEVQKLAASPRATPGAAGEGAEDACNRAAPREPGHGRVKANTDAYERREPKRTAEHVGAPLHCEDLAGSPRTSAPAESPRTSAPAECSIPRSLAAGEDSEFEAQTPANASGAATNEAIVWETGCERAKNSTLEQPARSCPAPRPVPASPTPAPSMEEGLRSSCPAPLATRLVSISAPSAPQLLRRLPPLPPLTVQQVRGPP